MDFLSADYWEQRYQQQQTGWDIGEVSTPLSTFIDSIENKNAAILIPGCGNSYEAAYLIDLGFTNITVIDIAPSPVERLRQKAGTKATILLQNFFEHEGAYDYILEQTFFCALNPSLRPAYVERMHFLLKPGGLLAGVLFNRQFENNPPFGGSKEEYEVLFKKELAIQKMELCTNSIKAREGAELFFIATKSNV